MALGLRRSGLGLGLHKKGVTGAGGGSDTTPDAFSFTDVTGALTSTDYVAGITLAGLGAAAPVVVTAGVQWRKNGAAYVAGTGSAQGTAVNGDLIELKLTSSASASTAVAGTLSVGGVSDTFTVTTAAASTGGNLDLSEDGNMNLHTIL